MKRAILLGFLAATAVAAEVVSSDAGFKIVPPEGWAPNAGAAAPLVESLKDDDHDAAGVAWTGKGGALFVLWRTGKKPVEGDAVAAVQAALDRFAERKGQVLDSARAVGEWDATAFVTVEPERGLRVMARTTVFLDGKRTLREIRVECVLGKDQPAAREACEKALSSFALAIPDEELSRIKVVADAGVARAAVPVPGPPAVRAPPRPFWAGPGLIVVVLLLPVMAFFGYRLLKDMKR